MGLFFDRLVRVLIGSGGSDVVKHGVTFFYTTLSESCTGSPPRAPMRAGTELLTAEAHCSGVKRDQSVNVLCTTSVVAILL